VVTGNPVWDAVGTIMIGALLIIVAVFVAIEVKAMLIGTSIDPERERQLRQFVQDRPEVVRVLNLITLQLGNDAMLSVQAEMREKQSTQALLEQINDVERAIKREFPEVRWSFFEPDLRPEEAEPA
jgi:divalent metal cation (Fe/Co/Zn/Cd) transporter